MTRDEILKASPGELRVMVAEARGLTVIKDVPVYLNPECGELCIPYSAEDGEVTQPAFLDKCICEFREDGDSDYGGHIAGCLEVLPDWPHDIAAAWELIEDMIKDGTFLTIGHGGREWRLKFSTPLGWQQLEYDQGTGQTAPESICRAWLLARLEEKQEKVVKMKYVGSHPLSMPRIEANDER